MTLLPTERKVFESLDQFHIVDAHEHLLPEAARIRHTVDFFRLFCQYTSVDLLSAGMTAESLVLLNDQNASLEDKWKAFSPCYPLIRNGSFARPGRIWLKDVLGFDDLTAKNYKEVSSRLQEWNKPGLYKRILRDMCHIETILHVPHRAFLLENPHYQYADFDMSFMKPLWPAYHYTSAPYLRKFLDDRRAEKPAGLGEYLDWVESEFKRHQEMGVFGVKAWCQPLEKPDLNKAANIFKTLPRKSGQPIAPSPEDDCTLNSVIYDRVFKLAQEHRLTVAFHSGVWGDFRDSQPAHLIPVAIRYPGLACDLFHLGAPHVRDAAMIGKMFQNVSLNLCWCPILSPEQTCRTLDECLDMVPVNKIIAFGGDYCEAVEKVYGHLMMTKEIVARVLAKRIEQGDMDFAEAQRIAQLWLHDNPLRIYNLR